MYKRMNKRDRQTLKAYLLIVIFVYISYILFKSYTADSPEQVFKPKVSIRKKGVVSKLKDKIEKEAIWR